MYRQMPVYNREQDTYFKQMQEWHTKMAQFEEQLKGFHLERASQFRKMAEDRQLVFGNGTV